MLNGIWECFGLYMATEHILKMGRRGNFVAVATRAMDDEKKLAKMFKG